MERRIFLIAVAGILTCWTAEAATWKVATSVDPMDGKMTTVAQVDASLPVVNAIGLAETPVLVVRCRRYEFDLGDFDAYVLFDTRLFGDAGAAVRYKIDEGNVVTVNWTSSHSDRALFSRQARGFAALLQNGAVFHFDVLPSMHTRQYTRFSLRGSRAAIDAVVEACRLPDDEVAGYVSRKLEEMAEVWRAQIFRWTFRRKAWNGLLEAGHVSGEKVPETGNPGASDDEIIQAVLRYMEDHKVCVHDLAFGLFEYLCPLGFEPVALDDLGKVGRALQQAALAPEEAVLNTESAEKSVVCTEGHYWDASLGYSFCPYDGLVLDSPQSP